MLVGCATGPQEPGRQSVCVAGRPTGSSPTGAPDRQAGITQERLAAKAGVAIATVRKIETGAVVEPGYFTVMALIEALGARPDDLMV